MTKYFIALLALSLQLGAYAQTPPNWERIEMEVTLPTSPYYYPALMERYSVGDTTLTFDDYFHLYYGYPTQPGYKPLLNNPASDSLMSLFGQRTSASFETFAHATKLAVAILATEPFNLRDINALAYSLEKIGQPSAAAREHRKLAMIEKVIKSTGTGLTAKSPWYITYANHAEDIVSLMGLDVARKIIVNVDVEFLQVTNMPDKKDKGFYFNYAKMYNTKPTYLEDAPKQKRRMEINGTRPWELKKN